jgi:hypothetical protein
MFYKTEGNDSKNTINIKYFIKNRWDWTRMYNIPPAPGCDKRVIILMLLNMRTCLT